MTTLWRLLEAYHGVALFAPERARVYAGIGLDDLDTAYFATRAAPFGAVDPRVVAGCLYFYSDRIVGEHLAAAWRATTPDAALAARTEVFDRAFRRLLGPEIDERAIQACGRILADVVGHAPVQGSPMFAAHASTAQPDRGHLELFWAATALRELHGDAHVTALRAAGVSAAEGHVIMVALGLAPADQGAQTGWAAADWEAAVAGLRGRGWLTGAGRLTGEGRRQRALIEHETDRICDRAFLDVAAVREGEVVHVLGAVVGKLVTAGAIPYPNRVGLAPVAELAVRR